MSDPQSDPALHDEMQPLSRQRQWQERKKAEGMCARCGSEPLAKGSSQLGIKCLKKQRTRSRQLTNSKPQKPGGPGRPQLR